MKLSRSFLLAGVLAGSVLVMSAGPASAWCGTPQAEPNCPTTTTGVTTSTTTGQTTTSSPTTTTVPPTTSVASTSTTTTTTVPSTTTTVEATTTTTEAPQVTTTEPAVLLCDVDGSNCEPFESSTLPATGFPVGLVIVAAVAALLAGTYLIRRARVR